MTRTLSNGSVELELGAGTWTARWTDCEVSLVDCTGDVDCLEWEPDRRKGAWHIETTRTGARARWAHADGSAWLELRLPAEGGILEVQTGYTPQRDDWVRSLIPVSGRVTPKLQRQLVNGYDSWSYAGVRADAAADSFWNATFTTASGALAVQAVTSEQQVTRITRDGNLVSVRSEGSPTYHVVDGSWGHETAASTTSRIVRAGEEAVSEPVAITAGSDPIVATEALAALLPHRVWDGPPALGWESWYHYANLLSSRRLLENAQLLRDRFGGRPGFDLFQIDDGWQEAYGAWWPRERFPADLGELVEQIHTLDLRCGLWLAPFMVQPGAIGHGTEHEDWCIVDPSTEATLRDRHDRWALDASNPLVVDSMRDLGAQVREWGVDMVKLDFLYEGAQEGLRHDPGVTGTQALRRGLRTFVDQLGSDVYVLGCGAPMLPMVGICHANRIGHDLAVPVLARAVGQPLRDDWSGWKGIKALARQAASRWALHGRWFHNDPEVVMAWGSDGRGGPDGYTLEESHTQAVVAALTGGPFLLADELISLLPDERAVLEDPAVLDLAWDERGFRPVDLFDYVDDGRQFAYAQPLDLASVWVAERDTTTVVALFNWTDAAAERTAPDGSTTTIPAHGARVLRV
ncbi:MAG: glycoside hydrolase family 36 protein [Acidimicrobiia bacterium]